MRLDGEPWWQELPNQDGEDLTVSSVQCHRPSRDGSIFKLSRPGGGGRGEYSTQQPCFHGYQMPAVKGSQRPARHVQKQEGLGFGLSASWGTAPLLLSLMPRLRAPMLESQHRLVSLSDTFVTFSESVQVHIRHSGTAIMLLNTNQLPGITKKMLAIAEREKKVSKTGANG